VAKWKAAVMEITDARNFHFTRIFCILLVPDCGFKIYLLQFCVAAQTRRLALRVN